MLEFLSGQEEVGPSLHLHLLECIREIKHYLTNKHVGREVEKVGNYRTEVFPSLCSCLLYTSDAADDWLVV